MGSVPFCDCAQACENVARAKKKHLETERLQAARTLFELTDLNLDGSKALPPNMRFSHMGSPNGTEPIWSIAEHQCFKGDVLYVLYRFILGRRDQLSDFPMFGMNGHMDGVNMTFSIDFSPKNVPFCMVKHQGTEMGSSQLKSLRWWAFCRQRFTRKLLGGFKSYDFLSQNWNDIIMLSSSSNFHPHAYVICHTSFPMTIKSQSCCGFTVPPNQWGEGNDPRRGGAD